MNILSEGKSKKRTYKKSAVTRERICRISLDMMKDKGFQGTTIRDICKKANVSVGTFYSYFPTKNDLLTDIFDMGNTYFDDVVMADLVGKAFSEQLILLSRHYARLNIMTSLDIVKVLYNPDNSWFLQHKGMQEALDVILSEAKESGEIPADSDIKHLADLIFSAFRGVCFSWCLKNGEFDLSGAMAEMATMILPGLNKKAISTKS